MPAILLEPRYLGSLLEGYRFRDRLSVGCPSVPVAAMITESNMRVEVERGADGRDLNSIWSGVWVPGAPVRGLQTHRKALGRGLAISFTGAVRMGRRLLQVVVI